jgi:hypothetical protein
MRKKSPRPPRTVAELMALWPSSYAFADDLALKRAEHARIMKLRASIPRDHWPNLLAAAQKRGFEISHELLEKIHERGE